jgi:hypothetical protein
MGASQEGQEQEEDDEDDDDEAAVSLGYDPLLEQLKDLGLDKDDDDDKEEDNNNVDNNDQGYDGAGQAVGEDGELDGATDDASDPPAPSSAGFYDVRRDAAAAGALAAEQHLTHAAAQHAQQRRPSAGREFDFTLPSVSVMTAHGHHRVQGTVREQNALHARTRAEQPDDDAEGQQAAARHEQLGEGAGGAYSAPPSFNRATGSPNGYSAGMPPPQQQPQHMLSGGTSSVAAVLCRACVIVAHYGLGLLLLQATFRALATSPRCTMHRHSSPTNSRWVELADRSLAGLFLISPFERVTPHTHTHTQPQYQGAPRAQQQQQQPHYGSAMNPYPGQPQMAQLHGQVHPPSPRALSS